MPFTSGAGCHIYTHNSCRDIVCANNSLLAIHSIHYGQPVNLPAPARVTDLFTGQVVMEHGTRINLGQGWQWLGGTHLFRVEYDPPAKQAGSRRQPQGGAVSSRPGPCAEPWQPLGDFLLHVPWAG